MPGLYKDIVVLLSAIFLLSCKSGDNKRESRGIDSPYIDYKIIATEGDDNLAIIAQLKPGDEFGEAISLVPPSSFILDGEPFVADTASFGGVFYELYKPIIEFSGKHILTYRNEDGKESSENFFFEPLTLTTTLPETFLRSDMELNLSGVADKEVIRIVMVDTSFGSEGLNYADTVENGKINITSRQLTHLTDGPVQLELIRENEKPVKYSAGIGSKITIYHTLRRQFMLKSD